MEIKLFEVLDRMTFLPVLCVKPVPDSEEERYLLATTGYGVRPEDQVQYIFMGKLRSLDLKCVWTDHEGAQVVRTLPEAHKYIQKHWDELMSGDVIDVEFVLGETNVAKKSQRLEDMKAFLDL